MNVAGATRAFGPFATSSKLLLGGQNQHTISSSEAMIFRSKDARWLIDEGGRQSVNMFLNAAESSGAKNIDQDAAVMFAGFIHFAIAYYLAEGRIKPDDIKPILTACALHVRHYAPDNDLDDSYLEETGKMVRSAVEKADRDPIKWIPEYRRLTQTMVSINEVDFCAALSAQAISAMTR